MASSGQTLNDRINAARYALAGQGLARCVCKSTTEEVIGPKKKHLDYLLACTHEPNVSIPQLANLLIERTNHIYWVVVFKALVTVHHLMSYGNERFIQYIASSNYSFELSTFLDKTAARDFSMSTFIRRYSRYINEKALSYRLLAFDLCKVKRGNEGVLRLMDINRAIKCLQILQNQLDALLEFDCSANDLNNGVINACFMLLFRDLIGLFACHNDGIINILNKYFTLNKKLCREAFDLYKKFLVRMDKVSDFLKVAEAVGIDKDEIPDLRRAPSSLIDALEQHLQTLETNKRILKNNSKKNEFDTHNDEFSSNRQNKDSSDLAMGSALAHQYDSSSTSFKEDDVKRALEEEARVLSQYGSDGSKTKSSSRNSTGGDKKDELQKQVSSSATIPKSIDDLFGDSGSFSNNNNNIALNALDLINKPSSTDQKPSNRNEMDPLKSAIKSAIMSATTTLEKQANSKHDPKSSGKKPSDDLFSLLDTAPVEKSQQSSTSDKEASSVITRASDPFSDSPFDIAASNSNGPNSQPSVMKPGNPFPDNHTTFPFQSSSSAFQASQNSAPFSMGNNASMISGTSSANYTNLGGLDGFGDLLQPVSAGGSANQSNSGQGVTKSSFNTTTGLPSTGLFKGDLDTTLANLAQNLTFDGLNKKRIPNRNLN